MPTFVKVSLKSEYSRVAVAVVVAVIIGGTVDEAAGTECVRLTWGVTDGGGGGGTGGEGVGGSAATGGDGGLVIASSELVTGAIAGWGACVSWGKGEGSVSFAANVCGAMDIEGFTLLLQDDVFNELGILLLFPPRPRVMIAPV